MPTDLQDDAVDEMPGKSAPHGADDPSHRFGELDALAAILPPDRCDRMAETLTDADVATLKHLAQQGMGLNTLRALASDLHYLKV